MNGIKELFIFAVWLQCMCFNMPGIITAFMLTYNVRSRDNRCNPQSIVVSSFAKNWRSILMAAGEKTVHYTKRGLKVVGPKSIFDLDEPPWVPDEKVAC